MYIHISTGPLWAHGCEDHLLFKSSRDCVHSVPIFCSSLQGVVFIQASATKTALSVLCYQNSFKKVCSATKTAISVLCYRTCTKTTSGL